MTCVSCQRRPAPVSGQTDKCAECRRVVRRENEAVSRCIWGGVLEREKRGQMNSALMFSKASDNWSTPRAYYDALNVAFSFGVDAAATKQNALCGHYYGIDEGSRLTRPHCLGDALTAPWSQFAHEPHWCNPPYSLCREFVAKAAKERLLGVLTVMLIPSRTDTRYFHDHLWDADEHTTRPGIELWFVKGRLKFSGAKSGAPFPSMVVVFRP